MARRHRVQLAGGTVPGRVAQRLGCRSLWQETDLCLQHGGICRTEPAATGGRFRHPTVDRPLPARAHPRDRLCCLQSPAGRMHAPTQSRALSEPDGGRLGGWVRARLHCRDVLGRCMALDPGQQRNPRVDFGASAAQRTGVATVADFGGTSRAGPTGCGALLWQRLRHPKPR